MKTDRVLSPEELEALLGASDAVPTPSASGVRYDFSSTDAAARLVLPLVEGVFDTVATSMRTGLLDSLRFELQVDRDGTRTMGSEELLASLSDPCLVSLFEAPPFPGTALIALDGALIHSLVDGFFGGSGRASPVRARENFSDIEGRMGRRVRDVAFSAISDSLVDFAAIECRLVREERNPLLIGSRHFRGPLIVLDLRIALGERGGVVKIALPQQMLEPIRASAAAALRAPERTGTSANRRWRSAIDDADIDLRCEMASVGLSVRDLVALRRGDVIPIDLPEEVTLDVAGIPLLEGRFGIRKGRRALRVDRIVSLGHDRESSDPLQTQEKSHERAGIGQ